MIENEPITQKYGKNNADIQEIQDLFCYEKRNDKILNRIFKNK